MPRTEKLAFISDIHSNLEALEAVLGEIGGTPTYCLGDVVGYGASPNEVIALLKEGSVTCIRGNHDWAALSGKVNEFNASALQALTWTARNLTAESRTFLETLPLNRSVIFRGETVYMAHGSPDDNLWEYVYPSTHSDLFGYYLQKLGAEAIALGHTHSPFEWTGPEGLVFNPGSVGQPRNGDPRASYAVLEPARHGLAVRHRTVKYDVGEAARKIIASGLPPSLASRLQFGQ